MRHLKTYKIFEAIAPTLREEDFGDMRNHIRDITQDLSDEGFVVTVSLASNTPMGFVNEFDVRFHKPGALWDRGYGQSPNGNFTWDDIKDRVSQIISTVNEETKNEFIFLIKAGSGFSIQQYSSLEQINKDIGSYQSSRILKELSKFNIRFINKASHKSVLSKARETISKISKSNESSDFNTIENSDISEDVKDILLDAQDMGYTVELSLTTKYKTALRKAVGYHELSIRFYKKEGKLNQTFSTGDIKETNQRLLNYFGDHLIGTYYNDLVSDNCLSSTGKLEDIWRLSTNTDGPSGHRFPENLETKGLSMKYNIDKNIEIVKGKILEKEMPDEWFDKNPTNYLLTNKHIKQKPKMSRTDKTFRSWLMDLDYKDIIVTKTRNEPQVKYTCTRIPDIDKEYFMTDNVLMEFFIQTNEFNRIHTAFGGQLNPILRDMGIGYKCYKAIIDKVGWVRSSEYCSNENSRRVWKSLIKDPDYYVFEVETTEEGERYNGFIVFKKTMDKPHIKEILKKFTKDGEIKGKVISSGIGK